MDINDLKNDGVGIIDPKQFIEENYDAIIQVLVDGLYKVYPATSTAPLLYVLLDHVLMLWFAYHETLREALPEDQADFAYAHGRQLVYTLVEAHFAGARTGYETEKRVLQ